MARQRAIAALALSNSRDVEYAAAFALAVLGDDSRSQALASDLSRRFPEDTKVRFIFPGTPRSSCVTPWPACQGCRVASDRDSI